MVSRRNPLTGLSGLQHALVDGVPHARAIQSQSPYGAKWFATYEGFGRGGKLTRAGRNPLTGLSGLQRNITLTSYWGSMD